MEPRSVREIFCFEVTRVGKGSERIRADSCAMEGTLPARYVFRKNGVIVDDVFVYALEKDPEPIYSETASCGGE